MEYKIRKITQSDIAEIEDIIDTSFSLKTHKKKALIKWKFFEPHPTDLFAYGAFFDKKLVSFYSDKKIATTDGIKEYKSTLCLDMCTSPLHRRKGLISNLSQCVYKHVSRSNEFSFGFSNQHGVQVDKYSKDYGYHIVSQLVTYRKILFFSHKYEFRVEKVSLDDIEEFYTKGFYQLLYDQEYTKWRYSGSYILKEYSFYKVHLDDVTIGYFISDVSDRKIGIVKIIAESQEDYIKILQAASFYFKHDNKHLMTMTLLPNSFWHGVLIQSGFLPIKKKENYYFTVFPHNKKVKNILDPEKWVIMGGDIL